MFSMSMILLTQCWGPKLQWTTFKEDFPLPLVNLIFLFANLLEINQYMSLVKIWYRIWAVQYFQSREKSAIRPVFNTLQFGVIVIFVTRTLRDYGPLPSEGNFVFLYFCPFCLFLSLSFFLSFCCFVFLPFCIFCLFCIFAFLPFCLCVFFCLFPFLSFLSFCLSVFLPFFCIFCLSVQYSTVQYSMVEYSTGEEDCVMGWLTPYSTPCVVSGSTHIKKKLLKSGHCPEGGRVPGLPK